MEKIKKLFASIGILFIYFLFFTIYISFTAQTLLLEKLPCSGFIKSSSDLAIFNTLNSAVMVVVTMILIFIINRLKKAFYKTLIFIFLIPLLLLYIFGLIRNLTSKPDIFGTFHKHDFYTVAGLSMLPTYRNNEIIQEYNLLKCDEIKSGDIVVFDPYKVPNYKNNNKDKPNVEDKSFVKRVIGIEGDEIVINGDVYVNMVKIDEPYLATKGATWGWKENSNEGFVKTYIPIIVPRDFLFVLGDNREGSSDSRDFGFVPISAVKSFIPLEKQNFNK